MSLRSPSRRWTSDHHRAPWAAKRAWCLAAVACTVVLLSIDPANGQTKLSNLQDPVALAVSPSGQAYVFERSSGRIVRSGEQQPAVVVGDLRGSGPDRFTRVAGLTIRNESMLAVIGLYDGVIRLVTYKLKDGKAATLVEGLSGDFPFGDSNHRIGKLVATATTDFAIYLAVEDDRGRGVVLRIPTGRASLDKPQVLFKQPDDSARMTAMAMNGQGQLVVALTTPGNQTQVRFHHAHTGQLLLDLTADVAQILAIDCSQDGSLYAAVTDGESQSVVRLDAGFDGTRQVARATEIAKMPGLVSVGCASAGGCLALVGGDSSGRLVHVDVD